MTIGPGTLLFIQAVSPRLTSVIFSSTMVYEGTPCPHHLSLTFSTGATASSGVFCIPNAQPPSWEYRALLSLSDKWFGNNALPTAVEVDSCRHSSGWSALAAPSPERCEVPPARRTRSRRRAGPAPPVPDRSAPARSGPRQPVLTPGRRF